MRAMKFYSRRATLGAGAAALATSNAPILSPAFAASSSSLPPLGLGSCCDEYDASYSLVLDGLRAGYRLVDTAAHYASEPAVGAALAEARKNGIDGVRTVTKIWFDDMGYEPALASAMRSIDNLQVERLDCLLIHFPGSYDAVQSPAKNKKLRVDTWKALEKLQSDGRVKKIGLSNYTPRHLRETLAEAQKPPSILQTELHPRFQQRELIEYAREPESPPLWRTAARARQPITTARSDPPPRGGARDGCTPAIVRCDGASTVGSYRYKT